MNLLAAGNLVFSYRIAAGGAHVYDMISEAFEEPTCHRDPRLDARPYLVIQDAETNTP